MLKELELTFDAGYEGYCSAKRRADRASYLDRNSRHHVILDHVIGSYGFFKSQVVYVSCICSTYARNRPYLFLG